MIDGVRWSRRDHSAGCVTLSDGTVVVSVFGGCTTSGAISEPCFYQWGNFVMIVIQEDDRVSFAVFRSL